MKKFGAFIGRITRDDFRVNAFYDVGLKILMLITVVLELFGLYSFFINNPIYTLFVIDIIIAILLFFILFVINLIKRKRNKHTQNILNRNGDISPLLSTAGSICFLIAIFISPKNAPLLLISIILLIGSIAFYVLGYKQAQKDLHYEKIA